MNTLKIFIKSYVHMIFNYLRHSVFSHVWLNNFIELSKPMQLLRKHIYILHRNNGWIAFVEYKAFFFQ